MPTPFSGLPVQAIHPGDRPVCPVCRATSAQFIAYYSDLTRFLMRCECDALFIVVVVEGAAEERIDRGPLRALIVEPHSDTRELYCAVLTFHGIKVMSVATAQEAARAIVEWRPRLVSTELRLPDCDGLDFW